MDPSKFIKIISQIYPSMYKRSQELNSEPFDRRKFWVKIKNSIFPYGKWIFSAGVPQSFQSNLRRYTCATYYEDVAIEEWYDKIENKKSNYIYSSKNKYCSEKGRRFTKY